jgi:hypothetical protein
LIQDWGLDGRFLWFLPRMTWLRISLRLSSTDCPAGVGDDEGYSLVGLW